VLCVREKKNGYRNMLGKPEGKSSQDLVVDGGANIKIILRL
jgi:hypothetical protein